MSSGAYVKMKFCIRCEEQIKEYDENERWAMVITKKGRRIIEFEAFHLECWKKYVDDSIKKG